MYELKRKIGILLGDKKEVLKKNKMVKKVLYQINLKNSKKHNIVVKNYGVDALRILYDESKKYGVELWLDFGTLLGWYREKDFISYDMDIDLGAFYKDIDKFQKMQKSLIEKGFIYSRTFEYDGEIVEESYSYQGLNVDIVYYKEQEGAKNIYSYLIVYGMDFEKKPMGIEGYIEQNSIQGLKKIDFKGLEVSVPANTEEYLKNYYGETFMIPIPNFDWKASGLYIELENSGKCKAKVYDGEEFSK